MLAGEKSTFAIECEIRDEVDTFIYCNLRFWIAGNPIGDWNKVAVLGVVIHSAKIFMLYSGSRYLEFKKSMTADSLWFHIDRFSKSDKPAELQISLEGRYRQRFLLHEIANDSVATEYEVIVVERLDDVQRLLWKSKSENDIHELNLPSVTVDTVIANFLHWAESR